MRVRIRGDNHEEIRRLSIQAGNRVKKEGLPNDLFDRLCASEKLHISKEEKEAYFDAYKYTGRASEQVTDFLTNDVNPVLKKNKDLLGIKVTINK